MFILTLTYVLMDNFLFLFIFIFKFGFVKVKNPLFKNYKSGPELGNGQFPKYGKPTKVQPTNLLGVLLLR